MPWTKDAMAENFEFDSGELNSELRGPSIFAAVAVKMDATRAVVLLRAKLTIVWCYRMKKFLCLKFPYEKKKISS